MQREKILLKSTKEVAVMDCPICGTIYQTFESEVPGLVEPNPIAGEKPALVIRCPHCGNYNDYSKAEWVEEEKVKIVMDKTLKLRKKIEKLGF